jgi:dTDP-glucose 4,6-dehydratase
VRYHPLPADDPVRRRPVITRARDVLGWEPGTDIVEGLRRTVAYFGARPDRLAAAAAAIRGGQDETVPLPAVGSVADIPHAIPGPANAAPVAAGTVSGPSGPGD